MADNADFRREDGDAQPDEDEIDENSYKTVKDAVLFAIDVSPSMVAEPVTPKSSKAGRDSATKAALKCAYQLMQQRIISNPNDVMGVLLYGTDKSRFTDADNGRSPYPHCYVLTDLDVPYAADVKRVRALVEDDAKFQDFMTPSSEPVSMSDVLFCANQIFSTKASNFSSRRLFLVTNNDDPHKHNKELKNSSIVRAKDLFDLGVTIELFPISQGGKEFDTSKFYDDIVYSRSPDPEAPAAAFKEPTQASTGDGIDLLTSLLASVFSKIVPKRTLFSNLTFDIAPNLHISVKGYILFKRQEPAKTNYIYLDGETPVLAVPKSAPPQDSVLPKSRQQLDVRSAYKFGGEFVLFKPEEVKEMLSFGEPVIRLIGFKPMNKLPLWANLRPSTFIYPSEESFLGSTRTFASLLKTMLNKEVFGLVWYIARRNAAPVVAALIPGKEHVGTQNQQVLPPGLWLTQLPFADDIREPPELGEKVVASGELIDKMRPVIGNLMLPGRTYDPLRYPNPALQWHYRILHALALEDDMPEAAEDKTYPKYNQIHQRVGRMVIEWGETLETEIAKWQEAHQSSRPLDDGRPTKRSKTQADAVDPGDVEADMSERFKKNAVGKATLPQLKAFLGLHKLALSGKKDELVERIESYFEQKR